jgi:hypothetical protein
MGLLNAFKENKRKRVELKVEQKWEIIEYVRQKLIIEKLL